MSVWVLLMTAVPGWQSAAEPFGVSSASAILYEPERGLVLYEKDIHTPRSMASTTKVMTGLLALEQGDLDREITVPAEAVRVEGSALGLRGGDTISMRDLVIGLLLESGNDAANVIAYVLDGSIPAFAERMNARAAEIGMKDTTFVTPSGLDEGEHSSSAYDMALLARACLDVPELKEITATRSTTMEGRTFVNHNKLLWRYEGCVGMKTGYTQAAGRTLVSAAERDGMTLIAVTLNAPSDWADHAAMLDYGFANYQMEEAVTAGQSLCSLPVSGSLVPFVSLKAEETLRWPVGPGESLETRLELGGLTSLEAPVQAGVPMGRVEVLLNGEVVGESDLSCAIAVHRDRQEHTGWLDWLFG